MKAQALLDAKKPLNPNYAAFLVDFGLNGFKIALKHIKLRKVY